MRRSCLIAILLLGFQIGARASEDSSSNTDNADNEQSKIAEEGEDKGIIPKSADITVSSQTVTPVTAFPEKKLYDQAVEEFAIAQALWTKGDYEAASDTALEAYDDFCDVHMPRKKRKKLYLQRHQAAKVYIDSSIVFIKEYVEKSKKTAENLEEGHSRLEDLHDVAQNYPELNKQLLSAEDQISATKPH
jgi:hypothetical protein